MKRKYIYAVSSWPSRVYTRAYAYTCTFMQGKVRICWRTYFWSVVVSPWYLNLWFWTIVSRQMCWSQVLGPWYWFVMVLDHGIEQGLSYKRRRISLGKCIEKVLNICWSMRSNMQVMGWWCIAWSELRRDLIGWWRTRSNDRSGSKGLKWTISIWLIMFILDLYFDTCNDLNWV